MKTDGRVALVTGAGSPGGIGFAAAKLLSEQGVRVVISSTTKRIFDRLAELPGEAAAFIADLTEKGAGETLVKKAAKHFGRSPDILVNNAGMAQVGKREIYSRFEAISDGDWARALDLNLTTAFVVTRAALPAMLRRKYGRIVHVSSVTGPLVSNPRTHGYSAAKAALLGMTRSLAVEVARQGVTVNAVGPGWIDTGALGKRELRAGAASPAGRSGTGAEVGAVIAFLASEAASYVTGQLIVVDGGNTIQEFKGSAAEWY